VLREASAHVLAEAELEYTWIMALFEGDPDDPELGQLADEFGTFMSAKNRRQVLRSDRKRGAAQVEDEIKQRAAERSHAGS
jgi:hypothetical protein